MVKYTESLGFGLIPDRGSRFVKNNFAIARSWAWPAVEFGTSNAREPFVVLTVGALQQMQEMVAKAALAAQASGGMEPLYAEAFRRAAAQVESSATQP